MRILCFNKNNTSDFSVRLMQLVSQARMCDKEMREFASGTHKYKFKPVTSIQKVRKFEKKYNITLPENYVRYLTEVGNGGAGPDYGLYSLEKVEEINEHLSQNDDFILFDLDDEGKRKEWIRMCESANNDIEERCEYLKMIQRMESGALIIGTPGCTMYNVLMIKGKHYGEIGIIDTDMIEEYEPHLEGKNFEEWMFDYFQKIIDKYSD